MSRATDPCYEASGLLAMLPLYHIEILRVGLTAATCLRDRRIASDSKSEFGGFCRTLSTIDYLERGWGH
jgi:hypothetical protein